jgi:hypothetical protein
MVRLYEFNGNVLGIDMPRPSALLVLLDGIYGRNLYSLYVPAWLLTIWRNDVRGIIY